MPARKLVMPKNKAVAVLFVMIPTIITAAIGLLMALGIRAAGRALSSPVLEGNAVFVLSILSFTFTGFMVGMKTLMRVRAQIDADRGSTDQSNNAEDLV
jgi:UPF0716 family protein affecting phage T7 exclusion